MIIKFPNQRTLNIECTRKCGTTSAFSIIAFPRVGKHKARSGKPVLKEHNEWWKTISASPYTLDTVDFNFAIVRDPVSRIVSCFKDRVMLKNNHNSRSEIQTWDNFIYNLEYFRNKYHEINLHSVPQCEKLGKNPSLYNNVYNTKEIGTRFIEDVSNIAEVTIPTIRTKNSDAVTVEINVTDDQVKIIEDFYSDDYKYWGDYFQ